MIAIMCTHRWLFASLFVLAVCVSIPQAATARGGGAKRLRADAEFGIGPMIGVPSGLTGKYYFGGDTALDFGVGAYHRLGHHGGLHLHMDFLWHPVVLLATSALQLPLHVGLGARIWDHDDYIERGRYHYDDHTHFGVRAPVGLTFYFNRVPLDVFCELALVVDVVVTDDQRFEGEDRHGIVDLNSAIGLRYYF